MKDLEWYLDLSGKKTGPFTPKDIVEMFKAGKVQSAFMVTAERLHGEWITVQELVDAYKEISTAPKSPWQEEGFAPPPRPTEQLEVVSHTHYSEEDQNFDPTDNLYQVIRNLKSRTTPAKPAHDRDREVTGSIQLKRAEPFLSPQAIIVSILGVLVFGAVFAMWQILKANTGVATKPTADDSTATSLTEKKIDAPAAEPTRKIPTGKLMSDGNSPARTTAPNIQISIPPSAAVSNDTAGGAAYESDLSPEVMAEMQAAQEQDARNSDDSRRPAAKKRLDAPPVPQAEDVPESVPYDSEDSDPNDGGVASDGN